MNQYHADWLLMIDGSGEFDGYIMMDADHDGLRLVGWWFMMIRDGDSYWLGWLMVVHDGDSYMMDKQQNKGIYQQ